MMDDMIEESKEDRLILDKPGIKGWVRNSTSFSDKVPMIKLRCEFKEDIDPMLLMELLTNRKTYWNKEVTMYEELANDDDWTIYRYIMRPPIRFSSPLYFVEKRLMFEEEGALYGYYTSVPDNVLPLGKNYRRCDLVFGGSVVKKEKNVYAYYSLSQIDAHVNGTIASLILSYAPSTSEDFYKTIKKTIYNL